MAQHLVGDVLLDAVALHHDALRALDQRPAAGALLELVDLLLERVPLVAAAAGKLDGALHRSERVAVRVGVGALLQRLPDQERVVVVEQEHDRAVGRLGGLDELQDVLGVVVQRDDQRVDRKRCDRLGDAGRIGHLRGDPVTRRLDQSRGVIELVHVLVEDEDGELPGLRTLAVHVV